MWIILNDFKNYMTGLLWTHVFRDLMENLASKSCHISLGDTHLQSLEEDWDYKHNLAVLWVARIYGHGKYNKRWKKDLQPCKNLKEGEILATLN